MAASGVTGRTFFADVDNSRDGDADVGIER
jgi:hypothetical protein